MSGDQLIALVAAIGLPTLLASVGAGVRWLVTTLNAAYKAQTDATLTAKNLELDLLRQDRDRWKAEAERCRGWSGEAHG